jgi:hypothetical protein
MWNNSIVQTNPAPGFTTYLVVDGNQGQVCLQIHLSNFKKNRFV